ncbi:hypothetical protein [Brevibacillus sp. NRS-1366]|uniref:hypothetical protein n=1 Tax=Brevibacillus sp. NRS-1366 TaxID=3233899 RepID=UPI003D1BB4CF
MKNSLECFIGKVQSGSGNYKYLNLTEEELVEVGGIRNVYNLATTFLGGKVSICVCRNRTFEFVHLTTPDNVTSIKTNGLLPISSGVYALGEGLYLANNQDLHSFSNLQMWATSNIRSDELSLIYGRYVGHYLECIYPSDKQGFILVNDVIEPKHFTKIVDSIRLEDFLNITRVDLMIKR